MKCNSMFPGRLNYCFVENIAACISTRARSVVAVRKDPSPRFAESAEQNGERVGERCIVSPSRVCLASGTESLKIFAKQQNILHCPRLAHCLLCLFCALYCILGKIEGAHTFVTF